MTALRPARVYADTSVFGGVFDVEFERASGLFFEQVEAGLFTLVVSAVVQAEIAAAPRKVQKFLEKVLPLADRVRVTTEALALRDAYLQAGVVSPNWSDDALHVALATLGNCTMIVSWNFKHIVHYRKIAQYNAINVVQGYGSLGIYSPREVVEDEEAI